jgi:hypothetical protein
VHPDLVRVVKRAIQITTQDFYGPAGAAPPAVILSARQSSFF